MSAPLLLLLGSCSPSKDASEHPDPLVGAVTMGDVRWLGNLWFGCPGVIPEYDLAWSDHRLDEKDLEVVAAAVARERARDPAGRTCRYHHAIPPVMRRTRMERVKYALGLEKPQERPGT